MKIRFITRSLRDRAKGVATIGCIFFLVFCTRLFPVFANNFKFDKAEISSVDLSEDTVTFKIDVSWDNSFRDNTNYDAVWVFLKYSSDSAANWSHGTILTAGTNPTGFSQGTGTDLDIVVSADRKGFFLQRSSKASGSVDTNGITFKWDYAADGLSDADANTVDWQLFGIEMVYIPAGSFSAGDGDGGGTYYDFENGSSSNSPITISSENSLDFTGATNNSPYYNSAGNTGEDASGTVFTVASTFPKGYQGFYIMRYELTQGDYAAFLNTLSRTQQNNRTATDVSNDSITNIYVMTNTSTLTNRQTIRAPSSGNGTTAPIKFFAERPDRAMNYLSWMDLCAFADWAALRPLTELEYEKAARGTASAVTGEYAWGNTTLNGALAGEIDVDNDGSGESGTEGGDETISDASANVCYNNVNFTTGDLGTGPLRTGIFAEASTTTRSDSGASYYGVMDLSGNVWERVVTVGNSTGRSFTGTHGDGALTTASGYEGNATNTDWPGIDATTARGVTGATGSGFRGGAWDSTSTTHLCVSCRPWAAKNDATRGSSYGGRLARTATA